MDVVGISEDVWVVNTFTVLKLEIETGFFATGILVDVSGDRDDVACLKGFVEVNLDVTSIGALFFTHFVFLAVDTQGVVIGVLVVHTVFICGTTLIGGRATCLNDSAIG